MKRIGRDIPAAEYWSNEGSGYHSAISNSYHQHRLNVVRSLLVEAPRTVLDFGCGDGVMLADFGSAKRIGIEPDAGLLASARQNFPDATLLHGSVGAMEAVVSDSVDLILCLNVLAYMTDAEDAEFYRQSHRVLRRGGALVVTHSNELFDLFSLNAYSVDFFRRHFGCDVSSMLTHPNAPDQATYNVRENPLTYRTKLAKYGFLETRQEFINFHEQPPILGKDDTRLRDTLSIPADEKWSLMFRCSTFASLSRRD
jgi:SAM-dependent methyltransferase